jgi:hypothetical protein
MATLFDRLNQELEAFGKRAQAALDGGKSQIELLRVKRQRDNTARDLGLLIYQRERAAASDPAQIDTLMLRLDDLEKQIATLEREISAAQEEACGPAAEPVAAQPAAAGATSAADADTTAE